MLKSLGVFVAVPKSLREVVCPRPSLNATEWDCPLGLNSTQLYRIFVLLFGGVVGPFVFGNIQKTRLLQLTTTFIRHASFALLIILAVVGIAQGQGRDAKEVLLYEDVSSLPIFFGVCIYSFMCHHR